MATKRTNPTSTGNNVQSPINQSPSSPSKPMAPNATQHRSYSIGSVANSVAAGYAAGICGVVVGHPLDSIKVLLQTKGPGKAVPPPSTASVTTASAAATVTKAASIPTANAAATRAASSSVTTSATTVASTTVTTISANMSTLTTSAASPSSSSSSSLARSRSIRALYAGMTGPLLTIGVIQSVNFALYDSFRRILYDLDCRNTPTSSKDYLHNDSLFNVALASGAAGAIISFGTSPMMIIKTKQQIMVWGFRKSVEDTLNGGGGALGRRLAAPGIRNFFTGFAPHAFCDTFGRAVYFSSYEFFKRSIVAYKQKQLKQQELGGSAADIVSNPASITIAERMTCAALSGMACWSFIFPMDVVRSKMYAQTLSSPPTSAWDMMKQTYKKGGLRPFYRGYAITVLRAGPVAAAILPVYDMALEWLTSEQ